MSAKKVTIIIPNYKTLEITKICLRLIRKHTKSDLADVIVVDNDSNDASTQYLRSLRWISLIERKPQMPETGVHAHARALDLAFQQVRTPYVLSIHTDTFVKSPLWLDVLLAEFDNPLVAGVGSWKLESKNWLQMLGVRLEQSIKYVLHRLFGYKRYNKNRINKAAHYLRSHCAIYRTDIIKQLGTCFSDGDDTAGRVMHQKMVAAGYQMKFLPSHFLGQYLDHLNHATSIFNPELRRQGKTSSKEQERIKRQLRGIDAERILADDSLDQ